MVAMRGENGEWRMVNGEGAAGAEESWHCSRKANLRGRSEDSGNGNGTLTEELT